MQQSHLFCRTWCCIDPWNFWNWIPMAEEAMAVVRWKWAWLCPGCIDCLGLIGSGHVGIDRCYRLLRLSPLLNGKLCRHVMMNFSFNTCEIYRILNGDSCRVSWPLCLLPLYLLMDNCVVWFVLHHKTGWTFRLPIDRGRRPPKKLNNSRYLQSLGLCPHPHSSHVPCPSFSLATSGRTVALTARYLINFSNIYNTSKATQALFVHSCEYDAN